MEAREIASERATATGADHRLPRIAFVVSQFPETHETFILRELEVLDAMGLDFVIFSLKPCRDKIVQSGARRFVERTYYSADAGGAPLRLRGVTAVAARVMPWGRAPVKSAYVLWAARRFAGLAARLGVGHMHAHWATAPASAAAVMAEAMGVRYSLTAHAWDIYAGDGKLSEKARDAAFVVTCTAANVEAIRAAVPRDDWDKIALNYHGIPAAAREAHANCHQDARGDRPLKVAAVGRLVETKGFEYLIAALAEAPFPFETTIAGDGPLRGRLERLAERAGIRGRVRFAGSVSNEEVFRILRESDCLVMPSVIARNGDRDGIPNVMLEAMAAGLPVVASRVSGIPEAVVDGETGMLVGEKDAPAIAEALGALWRDREAARAMGARGRALVANKFDAETNAAALYRVFERFVGARQA